MSVPVTDVLAELRRLAPPELAQSWDNVGLLVDAGRPVTAVLTALDITPPVVEEAAALGCELIVAHHPVIFQPLKTLGPADVPALLLRRGISAVCMHTNLDAAEGGVNDTLAALLGLRDTAVFADGCGRIGTVEPTTAAALARLCAEKLGAHVQYVEAARPVVRVAESAARAAATGRRRWRSGPTALSPAKPATTPPATQGAAGWAWSLPGTGAPNTRSPPFWRKNSPRLSPPCTCRRPPPIPTRFCICKERPPWHWMPPRWRLSPGN